jgi:hypothetical protein
MVPQLIEFGPVIDWLRALGATDSRGADYSISETRAGVLTVPDGMRLRSVLFGDADHGYALEWSVQPVETVQLDAYTISERYRALLFATGDGGRTFRHYPPDGPTPPEFQAAPGEFLWASGDCTPGPCFELIEQTAAGQQRRHR